jgi:putative FmdB family regulatory protein
MPTYEYRCPKCGTRFELFQKITAKPVATCPGCRARAERLLSGGAGLVFKGSGFYITDYKRAGQTAEGGASDGAPPPPEAKPAAAKPEKKSARGKDR